MNFFFNSKQAEKKFSFSSLLWSFLNQSFNWITAFKCEYWISIFLHIYSHHWIIFLEHGILFKFVQQWWIHISGFNCCEEEKKNINHYYYINLTTWQSSSLKIIGTGKHKCPHDGNFFLLQKSNYTTHLIQIMMMMMMVDDKYSNHYHINAHAHTWSLP